MELRVVQNGDCALMFQRDIEAAGRKERALISGKREARGVLIDPDDKVNQTRLLVCCGHVCMRPNVRAEAGPTAKRQARVVENAPAHCAGLAF